MEKVGAGATLQEFSSPVPLSFRWLPMNSQVSIFTFRPIGERASQPLVALFVRSSSLSCHTTWTVSPMCDLQVSNQALQSARGTRAEITVSCCIVSWWDRVLSGARFVRV